MAVRGAVFSGSVARRNVTLGSRLAGHPDFRTGLPWHRMQRYIARWIPPLRISGRLPPAGNDGPGRGRTGPNWRLRKDLRPYRCHADNARVEWFPVKISARRNAREPWIGAVHLKQVSPAKE